MAIRFVGVPGVLPAGQCQAELCAFAVRCCDTKAAIRLLPAYFKIFLIIYFIAAVQQMLMVTQALHQLNQWSDWGRGTASPAAVSCGGEGSPPGSGASGGFFVPLQHHFSAARGCPCDARSPVTRVSLAEAQSGALTRYLKPKMHRPLGSRQQRLLCAAIHFLAWPGFVPSSTALPLPCTAPARGVMTHCPPLLKPPRRTIFFV